MRRQLAEAAIKGLGLAAVRVVAPTPADLDQAFESIKQENCDALFVLADVTRPTIVTLAARSKIPAIYQSAPFVPLGALASYHPNLEAIFRKVAPAAPYCHPRLQAMTLGGDSENPIKVDSMSELEAAAWRNAIRIGDNIAAQRIDRTIVSLQLCECLATEVLKRFAVANASKGRESGFLAAAHLLKIACELHNQALPGIQRQITLIDIKFARYAARESGWSQEMTNQLLKVRQTGLLSWKDRPTEIHTQDDFLSQFRLPAPNAHETALIDEMFSSANDALMRKYNIEQNARSAEEVSELKVEQLIDPRSPPVIG